jgi:flagellar hook-associated protein 1 FlgK
MNTGSLGGLLTFRSQELDQTRNTLVNWRSLLLMRLTPSIKKVLMPTATRARIFRYRQPVSLSNTTNKGTGALNVKIT